MERQKLEEHRIIACARCTIKNKSKTVSDMKPEDADWVMLADDDDDENSVRKVCERHSEHGLSFHHLGSFKYDHICAARGTWAFMSPLSSVPYCVVFLHVESPKKGYKRLGVDTEVEKHLKIDPLEMFKLYRGLRENGQDVHIWLRKVGKLGNVSAVEIAFDFCVPVSKKSKERCVMM